MQQNNLIQLLIAAVISLAGIALLFVGSLLDPQGEIHETILVAFGEIATFAGSIIGIDYHYKQKIEDYANRKRTKNQPSGQSRQGDDNDSTGTRNTPVPDA